MVTDRSDIYDAVIAGGGRLGIQTLVRLIKKISNHAPDYKPRILLVHDSLEFGGPAYTKDSSVIPLPFHQDVHGIDRSGVFEPWLYENIERVISYIALHGGEAGRIWIQTHGDAFRARLYNERRLPRAVYGLFLTEKLMKAAKTRNATIHLAHGRVSKPRSVSDGMYRINVDGGSLTPVSLHMTDGFPSIRAYTPINLKTIDARGVVWCPGLMPNPVQPGVEGNPRYLSSLYRTDSNMRTLQDAVVAFHASSRDPVKLIVGGFGPSTMDLFSWLHYQPELSRRIHITIITRNIRERRAAVSSFNASVGLSFTPPLLSDSTNHSANGRTLRYMIEADVQRGLDIGFTYPEILRAIYPYIFKRLGILPPSEYTSFHADLLPDILKNLFMIESAEASATYEAMLTEGKVKVLTGSVLHDRSRTLPGGSIEMFYTSAGNVRSICGDFFINCMGGVGQKVLENNNADPHINPLPDLLALGLARINTSGKGLDLDDHYQVIGKRGRLRANFYVASFLSTGAVIRGVPSNGGSPDSAAAVIGAHLAAVLAHPADRVPADRRRISACPRASAG